MNINTDPRYKVYRAMLARCYQPTNTSWKYYGARGVEVCESWRSSFHEFAKDVGKRPPGTSIDRIDNSLGYMPSNCRWATIHEQNANRRGVLLVSIGPDTKPLGRWAKEFGISPQTVHHRIHVLQLDPVTALTLSVNRTETKRLLGQIK